MNKKDFMSVILGALSGGLTAVIVLFSFLGYPTHGFSSLQSSAFIGNYLSPYLDTLPEKNISFDNQNFVTEEDLVINAVKKVNSAVVSIIITKDVPIIEQYYEDTPSGPFNFQIPQYRENGTEKKEVGGGSGFLVSSDGYIVTNKHVVSDEKAEYTVFLKDGTKYETKVVAKDPLNDVAILKIEAKDLPYLDFDNSDKLQVGQTVIAIGNPLMEFENSVSVGVVSGLYRSITAGDAYGESEQLEGVIQTDAAINPGNSGGPLLNLKGKVIGVNVAVASGENLGFSLPANLIKGVFDSVKATGKIIRPYLGLRYVPINEKLKEANKLSVDYGVLVLRGANAEELAVLPGSPADKAGLEENDIILEIDGKKLDKDTSLARIVAQKQVGDTLKLKVLHKGEEKDVEVNLEALPE